VLRVEGDAVVPVALTSAKAEHAARTIRPRILRHRDQFLKPLPEQEVARDARPLGLASDVDLADVDAAVAALKLDRSVPPVQRLKGGTTEARRRLEAFCAAFTGYASGRNQPADWRCSFMSPYLHFGQISTVEIALTAREARAGSVEDKASYLEELIVRRELAINNVVYNPAYDRYDGVPEWARRTLAEHAGDVRPHLYSAEELAAAADWLAKVTPQKLAAALHEHADEPRADSLAAALAGRAFHTTLELANAVRESVRAGGDETEPTVRRVFQALRIAVNDELGMLERFLAAAVELVREDGRIAVISYHSLEDRIVKNAFRTYAAAGRGRVLTKKVLVPSEDEVARNPRSRSAKMRVFER